MVVSRTRTVILLLLLLLQALILTIIHCNNNNNNNNNNRVVVAFNLYQSSSSCSCSRPCHAHHHPHLHRNMLKTATAPSSLSPTSCSTTTTTTTTTTSYPTGTRTGTQLYALLRPDWLRKASRVKRIQQRNNRANLESLSSSSSVGNKKSGGRKGRLYQCCNPSVIEFNRSGSDNGISNNSRIRKTTDKQAHFPSSAPSWKEQRLNVYLNIPETEDEANDQTNILCRLGHGDIVRSVSSSTISTTTSSVVSNRDRTTSNTCKRKESIQQVHWIEHDMGGWSPTTVDGMTRLVPIDGDDSDDVDNG